MQRVGWRRFCKLVGIEPPKIEYDGWGSKPITEAQKRFLHDLGIGYSGLKTRGQASVIISIAAWRKAQGLATPGQLLVLRELKVADAEKRSMNWVGAYLHKIGYVSKCPEWVKVARNGG